MTFTHRWILAGAMMMAAGSATVPARAASQFTILNISIDYGRAVDAFNRRRANSTVKIASAQEVINLTNDIMKVQVMNSGTAAIFCMGGQIYDLNLQKVIGTGGISSINPLPTGTMTLAVNDFSNGWSENVDPAYNKWLEDQNKQSSGSTVLQELMAHRYAFTVWPCDEPSKRYSFYFTLNSPTNDPVRLGGPMDGTDACPDGLRFNWNTTLLDGVPAAQYRVEVFEGEEAVNKVFDSGLMMGTYLFYPPSARRLDPDKTYTWRVTASDSNNGRSQASRLYRFRARCAGTRPVDLLNLESFLRRTQPMLFAGMGPVRLVDAGSSDGGVDSPAFQGLAQDLVSGKAKVTAVDLVLDKGPKGQDKKPAVAGDDHGKKAAGGNGPAGGAGQPSDQDKEKDKGGKGAGNDAGNPGNGGTPAGDATPDPTKSKGKKP